MRLKLSLIAFLFLLLTLPKCQHHVSISEDDIESGFTGDSGYIYDYDLLKKIKFDTIDTLYNRINISKGDTIGKYYKGDNSHYFTCLDASNGFVGYILVETLSDGTILKKEQFGVGIHDCCWNGRYEGFKKYGKYISFRSCTTGTGICGGSIQLFNALKAQDEIGNIVETMWYATSDENSYSDLTSKMSIRNDTVIMQYTVIDYLERENERTTENSKMFLLHYVDNNGAWTRLDSTKHVLGL